MSEPGPITDLHGALHHAGPSVRLLEAEPDLGRDLTPEQLQQARRYAVLPVLEVDAGPWTVSQLEQAAGVRGVVHGFLVLSGLIGIDAKIADRVCTRVIVSSELVLFDGLEPDSMPVRFGWSALEPVSLAILDERLLLIGRHWPRLLGALLARAAQQTRQAFIHQAISQLPRVEERLLALFWSLADRHGVARADGVWVQLPVTHETLARMIGAQRPTVSLGLTRLAESKLLQPKGGGWLLDPASLDGLTNHPAPGSS